MKLVEINGHVCVNVEKVNGLQSCGPDRTYIIMDNNKIEVGEAIYDVKKIIENAMKEDKE
jgi:hypothetical protein